MFRVYTDIPSQIKGLTHTNIHNFLVCADYMCDTNTNIRYETSQEFVDSSVVGSYPDITHCSVSVDIVTTDQAAAYLVTMEKDRLTKLEFMLMYMPGLNIKPTSSDIGSFLMYDVHSLKYAIHILYMNYIASDAIGDMIKIFKAGYEPLSKVGLTKNRYLLRLLFDFQVNHDTQRILDCLGIDDSQYIEDTVHLVKGALVRLNAGIELTDEAEKNQIKKLGNTLINRTITGMGKTWAETYYSHDFAMNLLPGYNNGQIHVIEWSMVFVPALIEFMNQPEEKAE